jgi:tetratricopeptide (TPR) repeat protein
LIEEVRQQYDWVLVDTPPVLFVSDTPVLGVVCDGVLMVIKSGDSSRALVTRAVENLTAVHARLLGTILNNVVVSKVGRYYSSYYHVGYSRYARDYESSYYASGADAGTAKRAARAAAGSPTAAPLATAAAAASRWFGTVIALAVLAPARKLLAAGRPVETLAALERVLESWPHLGAAWELRLRLLAESGNPDALRQCAERLQAQNAPPYLFALALGYQALVQGKAAPAEEFFREALAKRRGNTAAIEGLLRVAVKAGDAAQMRERRSRLLRRDPFNAFGLYVAAVLDAADQKWHRAERLLRRGLAQRRTPESLVDLAALLHWRGAIAECEQMLRGALALQSQSADTWQELGRILHQRQRASEAVAAYEQALALRPGTPGVLLELIELHLEQGDSEKARSCDGMLAGQEQRLTAGDQERLRDLRKRMSSR